MNKILVIAGPTATGKTKLALHMAEKFNGEIVSADSRQVYRHMNVVTGKDIPTGFHYEDDGYGYYTNGKTRIWGYDLVSPKEEFSVSHYSNIARKILADILDRGKLPIIEGGTGLYIDSVLKNMDKIDIPQNKRLRAKYADLSADELFDIYMNTFPQKALAVNDSDRKNIRRLIRYLEIADYELKSKREIKVNHQRNYDTLWIGLNYNSKDLLNKAIEERVEKRLGKNLISEIEFLKRNKYFDNVSQETPGYKYWNNPEKWAGEEKKYAKRQLTWFRKNKDVNWFSVESSDLYNQVEEKVRKWYSK